MEYRPGRVPTDADSIPDFLENELQVIASALMENIIALDLIPTHQAPLRPRAGMLVYADGTDWNPGNGEGLYTYSIAGGWQFTVGPEVANAITQATNKATGVTQNKRSGQITMNNAALNANTSVGFTLTNSFILATDMVLCCIASGATLNSYFLEVDAVAVGSCHFHLRNITGGNLSEAIVINYKIIKGVFP